MSYKCRLCEKGIGELRGAYLTRVNEKGVPGIWECRPTCESDLPQETLLMMAIESDKESSSVAELLRGFLNGSEIIEGETLEDALRRKADELDTPSKAPNVEVSGLRGFSRRSARLPGWAPGTWRPLGLQS